MALSQRKLERFIKMRNASGFPSNMQFMADAEDCGFNVEDLGDVTKHTEGVYYWETPFGLLVERLGMMRLSDVPYDKEYVLAQAMKPR